MNVAFYAPLKSPDHPVPSGDRQMARLLMEGLRTAGHDVHVSCRLRSYLADPDPSAFAALAVEARSEVERIAAHWRQSSAPDFWFTYHPYYKAPDLIGPALASRFQIPYATAEASYSSRRNEGVWGAAQERVIAAVNLAQVNFCFTGRDRAGLAAAAPHARLEMLPPFIDIAPYSDGPTHDNPHRLVTIAMMRNGDKFDSFRMLAEALPQLLDLPWTLSVIGGGTRRDAVVALFNGMATDRLQWLGQVSSDRVPGLLRPGGIYVWPGFGEAYGLAYLEAQAAGLCAVAQDIAGVPEVVRKDVTGILTQAGDTRAFAAAIRRLLTNEAERRNMAAAARRFVITERSLAMASHVLGAALERLNVH